MKDDEASAPIAPAGTDWAALVANSSPAERPSSKAMTFVRRFGTASQPVLLDCDNGSSYVTKALRLDAEQGKMIFTDQIAARIGALLGAPVPPAVYVEVPAELIGLNPDASSQLGHLKPGLAHGSEWISGVTDRIDQISHLKDDDNEKRFLILAVFYGLMHAADRQFIYDVSDPFRVYSHDHGHFFPGGPNWTSASLQGAGPAVLPADLIAASSAASEQIAAACANLKVLTDEQIARVVAHPPDAWGVSGAERADLAKFIACRRDQLLAAHPSKAEEDSP